MGRFFRNSLVIAFFVVLTFAVGLFLYGSMAIEAEEFIPPRFHITGDRWLDSYLTVLLVLCPPVLVGSFFASALLEGPVRPVWPIAMATIFGLVPVLFIPVLDFFRFNGLLPKASGASLFALSSLAGSVGSLKERNRIKKRDER